MIRRAIGLAAIAVAAAVGLDRWLATRRGVAPPEPIRTFTVIDAPPERVWRELADIEGQPRWMREMKRVRVLTPGPVGAGTRGEAEVRILGIGVTDPVTVTDFVPPTRFAIRHEGTFRGHGDIELEPGADGTSTIVRWEETLVPPVLPELGALVQRPILWRIFQGDLGRFRELIEATPSLEDPERAGSEAVARAAAGAVTARA
ncbi:MAG TPA: SRPBCC family protein [Candidatus Dormibacteraeota bacterium]|nr:SRPBCC family protein [Candidatus Dormibacteraeota bacterium]